MRYVLVNRSTVLRDTETGLRYHVPAALLPLLDYSKVDVHVDPPMPDDPIPLAESVARGMEIDRLKLAARRATRAPVRQSEMPLSRKKRGFRRKLT